MHRWAGPDISHFYFYRFYWQFFHLIFVCNAESLRKCVDITSLKKSSILIHQSCFVLLFVIDKIMKLIRFSDYVLKKTTKKRLKQLQFLKYYFKEYNRASGKVTKTWELCTPVKNFNFPKVYSNTLHS